MWVPFIPHGMVFQGREGYKGKGKPFPLSKQEREELGCSWTLGLWAVHMGAGPLSSRAWAGWCCVGGRLGPGLWPIILVGAAHMAWRSANSLTLLLPLLVMNMIHEVDDLDHLRGVHMADQLETQKGHPFPMQGCPKGSFTHDPMHACKK